MSDTDNQPNLQRAEVQEASNRLWIVRENVVSLLHNPRVLEAQEQEALEQRELSAAVKQAVEIDQVEEPKKVEPQQPTNVVDFDVYRQAREIASAEQVDDPVAQALQGVEDAFAGTEDNSINMNLDDTDSGMGLVA